MFEDGTEEDSESFLFGILPRLYLVLRDRGNNDGVIEFCVAQKYVNACDILVRGYLIQYTLYFCFTVVVLVFSNGIALFFAQTGAIIATVIVTVTVISIVTIIADVTLALSCSHFISTTIRTINTSSTIRCNIIYGTISITYCNPK